MYDQAHMRPGTPSQVWRTSLTNCPDKVPSVLKDICTWMSDCGVDTEKIMDVQIVLAEALNNIIEHGFEIDDAGALDIKINVSGTDVFIELTDNGKAFRPPNVTALPEYDTTQTETLPEGGFGWFLIQNLTSGFHWHRVEHKNRLTLIFF